jgi:hypothetical protein
MDTTDVSALFRQLADTAHLDGAIREPIRIWDRSGVERIHLSGGASVVFKYAEAPFDSEDTILAALAARGLPVPALHAAAHRGDVLGMLLEDLGPEQREADDEEGAAVAVTLHAVGEIPGLPRLGHDDLVGLPARSLTAARRHWPDAGDVPPLSGGLHCSHDPRAAVRPVRHPASSHRSAVGSIAAPTLTATRCRWSPGSSHRSAVGSIAAGIRIEVGNDARRSRPTAQRWAPLQPGYA